MPYDTFYNNALKTESIKEEIVVDESILNATLTSFIYSSEILDMIKKNAFYGKDIDQEKLKEYAKHIQNAGSFLETSLLGDNKYDADFTSAMPTRLFHGLIGILTEAGELARNIQVDNKEVDRINIGEELFDLDWYKVICMDVLKLNWVNLLTAGIEKLKMRYPNKFSSEKAINRTADKERELLEKMIK